MSSVEAASAAPNLKQGQLRNLILATLASTVGFWAWTIVGPLSKRYAGEMSLTPGQTAILVAMPIFVGSIAR
ncbi:MAG: MFS transporter, partial [Kocuria sp.]|nr:MFS transporter [Kocuria sp.]